jgi:hypothetical protein
MGERAAKEEERNDGTTQEINGREKRDRKEKKWMSLKKLLKRKERNKRN